MPFDLSSAKPVNSGFDLQSAKPVDTPDEWDAPYQKYVNDYNYYKNRVEIPGTPKRDQGPLLSKEDWRASQDEKLKKNIIGSGIGAIEQGVNLAGGVGGMLVAPVIAGSNAIGQMLQGRPTHFEKEYNDLLQAAGSTGTTLINGVGDLTGVDVNSNARDSIANKVGSVVNNVLTPISGLHFPVVGELPRNSKVPTEKATNKVLDNLRKKTVIGNTKRFYQRGAVDITFLQKRQQQLFEDENKFAREMHDVAKSISVRSTAERMMDLAKEYRESSVLITKASRLYNELAVGLNNSNSDYGFTIKNLENAYKYMLDASEALSRGDTNTFEHLAQNAEYAFNRVTDYKKTLNDYLAAVQKERSQLSRKRTASAIEMRNAIDNIINTDNVIKLAGKERGGLNLDDISKEARKFYDKFSAFGTKLSDALTPKERIVLNNIGDTSYVPKGDTPENIINSAKGQPDVPLNTLMQSGLGGAALKSNSAIHFGINRWLSWATKTADKDVRDFVKPIEAKYGKLIPSELEAVHGILKMEMFDRKQFTEDQLINAGLSKRGIEAYKALRDGFEDVFARTNESRAKLGLDPISKQSAYYSSNWYGNWHMPVYDKAGDLVGYVKTESRSEANKAIKWIKDNMPDVDSSKLTAKYKPQNIGTNLPRDVTSTFETMMKIFEDTPMAQQMNEMLDQYRTEQAFNERGHSVHFLNKANTRFFVGDRPWLSDRENAIAGVKAQVQYLKEAYRWATLQEAMANIKEVLSDPTLVAEQPNNIGLAKLYTANAMGISASLTKGLEQAAAQMLGSSPVRMGRYIGDLKNLTYLQQLGLSAGYAIATPTQALILGPSRHMLLSKEGYKYNLIKTMVNSVYDGLAVMLSHEGFNVTGSDSLRKNLLSDTGQKALRYMEDNGIINISMFDEHANLGEHKIWNTAKNTLGVTISLPEKAARTMTFMSFVHHLKEGGMEVGLDMFRKAEEMTNATLTEFHKNARPLIVDKTGMLGELAYTYKSPLFNYYNSLFEFAKYAKQTGDIKPFATAIIMTGVLGGVMNLPGMQELDGAINFLKGLVAKYKPDWYSKISNFGVKEFTLSHLPDVATYGLVSKVTGAQMASRFSNQVIDPENPLANVAPVAQEVKEQAALLKNLPIVGNPNETNLQQGIWMNSPPMVKGLMETSLDNFKGNKREDGTQTYYNPNKLEDRQAYVNRTKSDETYRKFGLTSLPEARQRDVRYINREENDRLETARDSSITKMFDAVIRKDKVDVQKYGKAYFDNNGNDNEFQTKLASKINSSAMTPEERQVLYANTIAEYMNIKRRLQMEQR